MIEALALAIQLGGPCADEAELLPHLAAQGYAVLAQGIHPAGRVVIVHNASSGRWAIFAEYDALAGTLCLLVEGDKLALARAVPRIGVEIGRGRGR